MTKVTLQRVSKRFGETLVVDDLDLVLASGALSTLLGPSGCGKTTTLRLIAGLERPSGGRIDLGEECVFDGGRMVPAERRGIGMVFQSYAVWPHLTVFENVAYPLRVRRTARRDIEGRVEAALRMVRLDHLKDRLPAQLSGGQQQRVALARAVVSQPKLLLLDEPLSNLDAQLRDSMRAEIRQLQQELGLTAVYITHDQHEALAISDFIAVMNAGKVVQQGAPRDIFEHPNCRFVAEFLGWTNFLPVEILDPRHVRILGTTIPCPTGAEIAAGGPACAAIRPDRIALAAQDGSPAAGPRFAAQMRKVTYLGTSSLCELVTGDCVLQAHVPAERAPAAPGPVDILLDPAGLRVIPERPPASGHRQ